MTKSQYLAWQEQLSLSPRLGVTAAVLLFDAGLAAAALWMIFDLQHGWQWAGQALLALFYFHNFAILHEAGHGNVHRRDAINVIVGHYTSLFCFLPFYPWRYIHHEHHTWTGNPEKDPTMKQILRIKKRRRVPAVVKFTWRSWIPLPALLQHLVLWFYPIAAWREGKKNLRVFRHMLASVLFLAAGYACLAAFAPAWLKLSSLWPSLVIYLVGVELVNFPHHLDMPTVDPQSSKQRLYLWEQQATTRSCRYPGILSELLVLNFNLHTEHHLFPTLPWFRLKQARALIKPALQPGYTEVHGVGWNYDMRTGDLEHIAAPNYIAEEALKAKVATTSK
jgi:acyl-lipid omega-6 desaturase (Delta-12 desaturase)